MSQFSIGLRSNVEEIGKFDFISETDKLDLTQVMAEVDYRLVEGGGERIQLDAMTARLVSMLKP